MVETFGGLSGLHWALLGAAVAVIGGGTGSSMGITYIANVAGGILTELPDRFGPLLPLVVIPGTQGIYGFITGVLVIFVMEPSAGWAALPGFLGFQIFLACLPVAFVCFSSGAYQGLTSAGCGGDGGQAAGGDGARPGAAGPGGDLRRALTHRDHPHLLHGDSATDR